MIPECDRCKKFDQPDVQCVGGAYFCGPCRKEIEAQGPVTGQDIENMEADRERSEYQ